MKGRGRENAKRKAEKKVWGGWRRAGREWKGRRLAHKAKEAWAGE